MNVSVGNTSLMRQLPGFSFDYLWPIAQEIYFNNPRNESLYHPHDNQSRITLTYDACVNYVGTGRHPYGRQDVYDRVLLWRVPLIALWATTTLPALGWHSKLFTLFHLIADPLDTLWSLFYKLDLAARCATWAREIDQSENLFAFTANDHEGHPDQDGLELVRQQTVLFERDSMARKQEQLLKDSNFEIKEYFRDVFALIVTVYEEWGLGDQAKEAIKSGLKYSEGSYQRRSTFRERCATAAAYIAADRVSRTLPSITATLAFFIQLFAGFWKTLNTLGDSYDDKNPASRGLNRAPHNIAFGAVFFWLPFAVLATAYVGGAQTSNSVARILQGLRRDMNRAQDGSHNAIKLPEVVHGMSQRWVQGGIPCWQPAKFGDIRNSPWFFLGGLFLSVVIVLIPTTAAVGVSWRTPTQGFGCRATTQISFFLIWMFSLLIDWILCYYISQFDSGGKSTRGRRRMMFWTTFVKDTLLATAVITILTESALGLFNSCDCWTKWLPLSSARYLSFPQEQFVFQELKDLLSKEFPIWISVALGLELVIFYLVRRRFQTGHRVLKQRDLDAILADPDRFSLKWSEIKAIFGRIRVGGTSTEQSGAHEQVPLRPSDRTSTGESQRRQLPTSFLKRHKNRLSQTSGHTDQNASAGQYEMSGGIRGRYEAVAQDGPVSVPS